MAGVGAQEGPPQLVLMVGPRRPAVDDAARRDGAPVGQAQLVEPAQDAGRQLEVLAHRHAAGRLARAFDEHRVAVAAQVRGGAQGGAQVQPEPGGCLGGRAAAREAGRVDAQGRRAAHGAREQRPPAGGQQAGVGPEVLGAIAHPAGSDDGGAGGHGLEDDARGGVVVGGVEHGGARLVVEPVERLVVHVPCEDRVREVAADLIGVGRRASGLQVDEVAREDDAQVLGEDAAQGGLSLLAAKGAGHDEVVALGQSERAEDGGVAGLVELDGGDAGQGHVRMVDEDRVESVSGTGGGAVGAVVDRLRPGVGGAHGLPIGIRPAYDEPVLWTGRAGGEQGLRARDEAGLHAAAEVVETERAVAARGGVAARDGDEDAFFDEALAYPLAQEQGVELAAERLGPGALGEGARGQGAGEGLVDVPAPVHRVVAAAPFVEEEDLHRAAASPGTALRDGSPSRARRTSSAALRRISTMEASE